MKNNVFIKKVIVVCVLIGVSLAFVVNIYKRREVFSRFVLKFFSIDFIFDEVDSAKMEEYLVIKDLNTSVPDLKHIFEINSLGQKGKMKKEEIDKCRDYYGIVLDNFPNLKEAHLFLGFCEYHDGNIKIAFEEIQKGLDSGPGIFWSSYNLAIISKLVGEDDLSEKLFTQTLQIPIEEALKGVVNSKLFQQYMQANQLGPKEIASGMINARKVSFECLKYISDIKSGINLDANMIKNLYLRIF